MSSISTLEEVPSSEAGRVDDVGAEDMVRTLNTFLTKEKLKKVLKMIRTNGKRRLAELEAGEREVATCEQCEDDRAFLILASCGHVFCATCYISVTSRELTKSYYRFHSCPLCGRSWCDALMTASFEPGCTIADIRRTREQLLENQK